MKFGIGLFSLQSYPEKPGSHPEVYRETLEQVKLAEKMNFDSVWLSEHHFMPDGYCPSALAAAAAMAAVTKAIKIGTAALILPLHNPVRIAEDAAVVDNVSNGRLLLGVALGYRNEEFDGFDIPIKQRTSRLEEGIDVIVRSWTEANFCYAGKRFQFSNLNVTPKPVQKPHIPIYIGAIEEPAIKRAGRLGFPLLIGPLRTTQMIKDTLDTYNKAARQAGRESDGVEHILMRRVHVAGDTGTAEKEAAEYIIGMYRFFLGLGVKISVRGKELTSPDDPLFDYLAEDRFIIGDSGDCIREVQRYRDELGIGYILCTMKFPKGTHKIISRCIKLFGKEVIPNI
jgi:alkanesulfonate monooxygenase SsuD/methylene tetrahydromethanopterin reductase-like flavin-dependent oxidoreductase (luciferase family)